MKRGNMDADVFIRRVEEYARQIVEELSNIRFEHPEPPRHRLSQMRNGDAGPAPEGARCGDPDCAFRFSGCLTGGS